MKALRLALPLLVLIMLAVFLWRGLALDPRDLPSALINKPLPAFTLATLDDPARRVSSSSLRGRVWLLNVWSSWCSACVIEHPQILDLSRRGFIDIVGLDYKDETADAREWLASNGNPYALVLQDRDGRTGIDLGVYGVPETFLIDAAGVIRAKHTGPVTQQFIDEAVLPLLAKGRQP
ncbi:MAG: DsbE family thiol:disulfide interchange protein [bacterium]|nr:DsbE family thiol:disulfide interchange protein [bacterium]